MVDQGQYAYGITDGALDGAPICMADLRVGLSMERYQPRLWHAHLNIACVASLLGQSFNFLSLVC